MAAKGAQRSSGLHSSYSSRSQRIVANEAEGRHRLWGIRRQRPMRCLLALTAARASRSASRRRSVSRLSQSCLPLATASSHFTRPLRK